MDYLFVNPKFDSFHSNAKAHELIAEQWSKTIEVILSGREPNVKKIKNGGHAVFGSIGCILQLTVRSCF